MVEDSAKISTGFTGTGKGLSYVGNHCFAFSGAVATSNSEVEQLNFTTGKDYIKIRLYPTMLQNTNANYRWLVKINGQAVSNVSTESQYARYAFIYVDFVIPPNTNVVVTATNIEDTSTNDVGSFISGKVYGN